jgi:hypothetical protein
MRTVPVRKRAASRRSGRLAIARKTDGMRADAGDVDADLRRRATELAETLEELGVTAYAAQIRSALAGTPEQFDAYLRSNELWGGAGSVADQAGIGGGRTEARRRIERALIALGTEQIRAGLVNVRTANWVAAFTKWQESGI